MPGPPPKTTSEQRERVLALVDGGRSYTDVAAEVFGDPRLRGRVERIVRRDRSGGAALPSLEPLLSQLRLEEPENGKRVEAESWLEQLVPLFGAMLKRRLEADLPVSGRELLALANLEWRLENQRQIERLNAMTRGLA